MLQGPAGFLLKPSGVQQTKDSDGQKATSSTFMGSHLAAPAEKSMERLSSRNASKRIMESICMDLEVADNVPIAALRRGSRAVSPIAPNATQMAASQAAKDYMTVPSMPGERSSFFGPTGSMMSGDRSFSQLPSGVVSEESLEASKSPLGSSAPGEFSRRSSNQDASGGPTGTESRASRMSRASRASSVGFLKASQRSANWINPTVSQRSRQSHASEDSGGGMASQKMLSSQMARLMNKKKSKSRLFSSQKNRLDEKYIVAALSFLTVADFLLHLYGMQLLANSSMPDHNSTWVFVISMFLLTVFGLEVLNALRTESRWKKETLVEAMLIIVSVVGTLAFGFLSLVAVFPRLLRIFKIAHAGKHVGCLKWGFLLVGTIVHSLGILLMGIGLYIINLVLFSVLALKILHVEVEKRMGQEAISLYGKQSVENCRHAFSSISTSMTTLLSLSLGGRWGDIAFPLCSEIPWALLFFILFVFFANVLVVGVICAALFENYRAWKADQVWIDQMKRVQKKQEALERLKQLFDDIDTDGNGTITWQDFYHNRQHNPEFIRLMTMFDLDASELDNVWDVLDSNGDGEVSEDDFFQLMWRLQSEETKWTLIRTGHWTSQVHTRVDQHQKQTQKGFTAVYHTLTSQQETLEKILKKLDARDGIASPKSELSDGGESSVDVLQRRSQSKNNSGSVQLKTVIGATKEEETTNKQRSSTASAVSKSDSCNTADLPNITSSPSMREALVAQHMQGVAAQHVAAYRDQDVVDFWGVGCLTDLTHLSFSTEHCDFFISHSWLCPPDWNHYFKKNNKLETYEYKKAVELNSVLQGLRSGKQNSNALHQSSLGSSREDPFCGSSSLTSSVDTSTSDLSQLTHVSHKELSEIIVWVDKCCIPQHDEKKKNICISLIEGFVQHSRGLIVLLSWNYFTRLWCVYEWACFLRLHHPLNVEIGCDAFLRAHPSETLPLYINSIERLSVKSTQCCHQSDHEILEAKVFMYYRGQTPEESFAAFERFAKCSAIGFMAKQIVLWRARGSEAEEAAWLDPVQELAERLGYEFLCSALNVARPAQWFQECGKDQATFSEVVQFWFENAIVKYLLKEAKRAVRPEHLGAAVKDPSARAANRFSTARAEAIGPKDSHQSEGSTKWKQSSKGHGRNSRHDKGGKFEELKDSVKNAVAPFTFWHKSEEGGVSKAGRKSDGGQNGKNRKSFTLFKK